MSVLLWIAGALLLGGVVGYYISQAIEWFKDVYYKLKRVFRGVGILIRRGSKVFKRLFVELTNGEEEEYYDSVDEGIEISDPQLSDEVRRALYADDYLIVETYN